MAITRSWRHSKENLMDNKSEKFLVKSNKSILKKIIEIIITGVLWLYMLIVVYFFVSACFDYNDDFIRNFKLYFKIQNSDIVDFLKIFLIIFILSLITLFTWKMYNKKRFGSLNRRKDPGLTSDEEMLKLNLIKLEDYKILKKEKIIIFDKNPVNELPMRK